VIGRLIDFLLIEWNVYSRFCDFSYFLYRVDALGGAGNSSLDTSSKQLFMKQNKHGHYFSKRNGLKKSIFLFRFTSVPFSVHAVYLEAGQIMFFF
jgi:hypothetical protein